MFPPLPSPINRAVVQLLSPTPFVVSGELTQIPTGESSYRTGRSQLQSRLRQMKPVNVMLLYFIVGWY